MFVRTTILVSFLLISVHYLSYAQTDRVLTSKEIEILKSKIGTISMPVFRVYEYTDKEGVHDLILYENHKVISDQDTLNTKIRALFYSNNQGRFTLKWKFSDSLDKNQDIQGNTETNIWFWSKYISFKDINQDSLTEPVIVYGTKTSEGYSRINIIIVYQGKQYSIKAQECELDPCRTLKKSSNYTQLPESIKLNLNKLLEKMRQEQGVILQNH